MAVSKGSTVNIGLVKSLGVNNVIDYSKNDFVENLESYDIIFDSVGKRKSSKLKLYCKNALSPGGMYISVDDGKPKLFLEDLILLKTFAEQGRIIPIIDIYYSLEKMAEAHRYVERGHKKGNIVVTV